MEKTELMKRYEETTYLDDDPQALIQIIEYLKECIQEYKAKAEELVKERAKPTISCQAVDTFQEIIRNQCDEISALKEKAEAYDRLISGRRKTLKEWANIFGAPVAVDKNLSGIVFDEIPELLRTVEAWRATHGYVGKIPSLLIDFSGDWTTSLTLPDGWEEKQ